MLVVCIFCFFPPPPLQPHSVPSRLPGGLTTAQPPRETSLPPSQPPPGAGLKTSAAAAGEGPTWSPPRPVPSSLPPTTPPPGFWMGRDQGGMGMGGRRLAALLIVSTLLSLCTGLATLRHWRVGCKEHWILQLYRYGNNRCSRNSMGQN